MHRVFYIEVWCIRRMGLMLFFGRWQLRRVREIGILLQIGLASGALDCGKNSITGSIQPVGHLGRFGQE
jgi:hypothetical protein